MNPSRLTLVELLEGAASRETNDEYGTALHRRAQRIREAIAANDSGTDGYAMALCNINAPDVPATPRSLSEAKAPCKHGIPGDHCVDCRAAKLSDAALEPPCEMCGDRRQVFATEAADPKVFEGGTITHAKPCPRCRPPEVPTCASWCGRVFKSNDPRPFDRAWWREESAYCTAACRDLGHPRRPVPREGTP